MAMGLTRANPQVLAHGPSSIQHTRDPHGPTDNTFFLGSQWSNLILPCMGRAHGYMRAGLADMAPSNPPIAHTGYVTACRLGIFLKRKYCLSRIQSWQKLPVLLVLTDTLMYRHFILSGSEISYGKKWLPSPRRLDPYLQTGLWGFKIGKIRSLMCAISGWDLGQIPPIYGPRLSFDG